MQSKFTHDDEEKMWSQGILGDISPEQLVETIVCMCGLYFGMRSETEHYNLWDGNIVIVERPGQTAHVIYNESSSKNNSGGLKQQNIKPKQVAHYANISNPDCCFIRFFKKYREHRPSCDSMIHDAFYLTPTPSSNMKVWFKTTPVRINMIRSTVRNLCAKSGVEGYK